MGIIDDNKQNGPIGLRTVTKPIKIGEASTVCIISNLKNLSNERINVVAIIQFSIDGVEYRQLLVKTLTLGQRETVGFDFREKMPEYAYLRLIYECTKEDVCEFSQQALAKE